MSQTWLCINSIANVILDSIEHELRDRVSRFYIQPKEEISEELQR